jgi:hypothetical protein
MAVAEQDQNERALAGAARAPAAMEKSLAPAAFALLRPLRYGGLSPLASPGDPS